MIILLLLSYRLKVKAAADCGIWRANATTDLSAKYLRRVIGVSGMSRLTRAVSVPLITLTFSVQIEKRYIRGSCQS